MPTPDPVVGLRGEGDARQAGVAVGLPYVAVRFPAHHVVFHMLIDIETLGEKPDDAYLALSERVQASVREALAEMGVHVVETAEEAIRG